jgi:hypothetical protein
VGSSTVEHPHGGQHRNGDRWHPLHALPLAVENQLASGPPPPFAPAESQGKAELENIW